MDPGRVVPVGGRALKLSSRQTGFGMPAIIAKASCESLPLRT
jgi:hypothetical protein